MKISKRSKKCKGVVRDVRNRWNSKDSTVFQRNSMECNNYVNCIKYVNYLNNMNYTNHINCINHMVVVVVVAVAAAAAARDGDVCGVSSLF